MDFTILDKATKLNDYRLKLFLKKNFHVPLDHPDKDVNAKIWRSLAKSSIDHRNDVLAQICFKKLGLVSPNFTIGYPQFSGSIPYDKRLLLLRLAHDLQLSSQIDDLTHEIQEITKLQSSFAKGRDIDLLLDNLMKQNRWSEALTLAEKKGKDDTISLVNYNYASYLEDEQQYEKAIAHYEASGSIVNKITSVIMRITEDHRQLQQYCTKSPGGVENDRKRELIFWYACFLRDHGEESKKREYFPQIKKLFLDIGHFGQAIDLCCSLNEANEALTLINTEVADDEILDCINGNHLSKISNNNLNFTQRKIAATQLGRELVRRFAYHNEQHSHNASINLYLLVDSIYPAIVCLLNEPHCNRLNCLQLALRFTTCTSVIYHSLISYYNSLKLVDPSLSRPIATANALIEGDQDIHAILPRAYLKLGLLDEAIQYCFTNNPDSLSGLLADLEILKAPYQPGLNLILSKNAIKTLISTASEEPGRIEIVTQLLIRSLQSIILYRYQTSDSDLLIKAHIEVIQRTVADHDFGIKDSIVDDICSLDTRTALSTSLIQLAGDNSALSYDEDILSRLINKFRDVVIKELASKCSTQGQYKQAAKLYSKLGDRLSAIKVLMRTNEVDIVVSYALVAKDKAVYQLTANYLKYSKADPKMIKLIQDKII